MDVNGTRFHLLLSAADWARAEPDPTGPEAAVVWSAERAGIGLRPLLFRFGRSDEWTPADRRGNGADAFGHVYHVGADERSIEVVTAEGHRARWWPSLEPETCAPSTPSDDGGFAPADAPLAPEPGVIRGLAVTSGQYLVAAMPEPAQLLVFDLHAGGPPAVLPWPGPAPFRPWDLAPRPDGGVWLLEADPADARAPARYWGLDRFFRLERRTSGLPSAFAPVAFAPEAVAPGEPLACAPRFPVTGADGWPLPGRPLAIESLGDGTVLVLDVGTLTGETHLARYEGAEERGRLDLRGPLHALFAVPDDGAALEWTGHDVAFVAEEPERRGERRGALFAVGRDGNQAFAFALVADEDGLHAAPREAYYPLRRFGGRGLLADRGRALYDFDGLVRPGAAPEVRWLPLVAQPKARFEAEGTITTAALDGREPGCVWHRLVVDACLPPGTAVRVETRAADTPERLAAAAWREEPAPYQRGRGPEQPFYRAFGGDEEGRAGVGSWELLFQRAEGRWLQLRLTLVGTGRSTPRLHAVRVHYPRFSYLREYLPAVYQQDRESAHFLDRFLANTEGFFTELEGRIAGVEALFDERLLQKDYLGWLAGWLGTVLDPAFCEARRRLFIRHAVQLYRERGTLRGLIRALRLALDECPSDALFDDDALDCDLGLPTCGDGAGRFGIRVVERFLTRTAPGVALGDPTVAAGPSLVAGDAPWVPEQGASRLHAQFREHLVLHHGGAAAVLAVWGASALSAVRFPPLPPSDPARLAAWRAFVQRELPFVYAEVGPADLPLYRVFLERRYRRLEAVAARYGVGWSGWGDVAFPATLPTGRARLTDWVQFVSLAVPLDRHASRFDVLVPVAAGTDDAAAEARVAYVRRLVEREKPAHTEFEVRPYWALFRVGEARLGLDTVLDRGSRFVPAVLPADPASGVGQGLGASTLGARHPWGVPDRFVTGRDRPGRIL